MNALNLAAFNGHNQEVDFLLTTIKQDVNTRDDIGVNPLI